jgi:hypothetical protein
MQKKAIQTTLSFSFFAHRVTNQHGADLFSPELSNTKRKGFYASEVWFPI